MPRSRSSVPPSARAFTVLSIALALTAASLAAPDDACAQETWAMTSFSSRGIEPGTAETFRELLQSKIASRTKTRFMLLEQECRDAPCAQAAGHDAGAHAVVFGSLGTLGQTVVISVTVVDADSGDTRGVYDMKVDRVEDLETAATRIAEGIAKNKPASQTAELGTITHAESKPAVRMETRHGGTFRVGAFLPMVDAYGDNEPGVSLESGYWFEANDFAVEPRIGIRFDATSEGDSYFEFPLDLTFNWIPSRGNFSPIFGLGGGLHWIWEDRSERMVAGDVVRATNIYELEESKWGFAGFARIGVLFLRTYDVRIALTGEFSMTFIDLNGRAYPNAANIGFALIL